MKKFFLMLALALPAMFVSCGDDDDPATLTLDKATATVDYNNTIELKASEGKCDWSSSNPFVAEVDSKGKVTAKHAGTAVITATKDNRKAECTVTVNATNNNFALPVLTFGADKATVKANVPMTELNLDLYKDEANLLSYTTAGNLPFYIYTFTDGLLNGASLTVTVSDDETKDFQGFLEQRYALDIETEDSFIYINANTRGEATMEISYGYDADLDAVMATWVPMEHVRSAANVKAVRAAHRSAARQMLGK